MNQDHTITCALCGKLADERETVRSLFSGGIDFSAGELHPQCAKILEAAPKLLAAVNMVLDAGDDDGQEKSATDVVDLIDWRVLRAAAENAGHNKKKRKSC